MVVDYKIIFKSGRELTGTYRGNWNFNELMNNWFKNDFCVFYNCALNMREIEQVLCLKESVDND